MSTPPPWLADLAVACTALQATDFTRADAPVDGSARSSAVLMLLGDGPGGPDVLLIARAASLRDHAGQVAFPGGRVEDGDAGVVDTALREAHEETGLDPAGVVPLAVLPTLFVPRSRHAVAPVLAWWRAPSPVGVQDAGEVAAVSRVPLAALAEPAVRATVRLGAYRGPCFALPGLFIWGFTASLLDRLLDLGGFARPWDDSRHVPLPATVSGLTMRSTA